MGNKGLAIFLFAGAIIIGFLLSLYYDYFMTPLRARAYRDAERFELLVLNDSIKFLVLSN